MLQRAEYGHNFRLLRLRLYSTISNYTILKELMYFLECLTVAPNLLPHKK